MSNQILRVCFGVHSFFFQVILYELILFYGTKGEFFFSLFSYAMSFNLAL